MTSADLAEAIIAVIADRDFVSFAELARAWPDHFNIDSPYSLTLNSAPNVVLWHGVSLIAEDAMRSIHDRIRMEQVSPLVYMADGSALNLPLCNAKSMKAIRNYKQPHWLPVALRLRKAR